MSSGPIQRGTKSEVATTPIPSRGPKRGRKCYATPTFSGYPNAKHGEQKNGLWSQTKQKNQIWLPHPGLLGGPKKGGNATSALHSRGSPTPTSGRKKSVVVPNKGEQNQKGMPHPCLLGGPQEGGNAMSALHSRGSPPPSMGSINQKRCPTRGNKMRRGRLTHAFSAAHDRAEMVRHPCILGYPQCQV